ncbi:Hsp20/alpha crystallin family protein [Neobacillus sp. LXY-4]|uniref:Hsp20/alpha crystallin family protein n=1 Tax=Neobacillus sp. LXY-4 TaxID=3379826 RepID=UPI003EE0F902
MFPWNLFPFNQNMKQTMNSFRPEDIEKYTQDIIGKMMSNHRGGMMNPQELLKNMFPDSNFQDSSQSSLQYTIYDTHEHVYVRITIKAEEWLKKIKIYHTANLIMIENIPNPDDKHSLTLPAMVKKKGATANYRDGILEISIPKSVELQYSEIDITEMF